jgi:NTE family protein
MKYRVLLNGLIGLLACVPLPVAAATAAETNEQAADPGRPRIGLVLGGGGARGAAHIGVLRELERMRIPIDAIAGTSMGAIVGGLYAAGNSPAELEALFTSLDWAEAATDAPLRKDLSFRRKQDDAQFPIDLELGLRDGELRFPKGLVQGQELDLVLRELTMDVAAIDDFDDLPIPFRAIATDIEHGDAYVMGDGDLAQAIRASMSVPAIFAPVRIGDHLLVDGGVAANLPVDVVRKMGVDIVIAVDVEFPLYDRGELDSALAISEQMVTILIRRETLRQIESLGERDVLIRPELGTFASTAFGEIADAIEPGAAATAALAASLSGLALDETAYAEYLAHRQIPAPPEQPIEFVRVVDDGRIARGILESEVRVRPGDPIDASRLAADANRLYGLHEYEKVGYGIVEEDGRTGVEFQARNKSWGPNLLKFSMALEDDFEGATGFNVGVRLTRADINTRGAEWRNDLQLGTDPLFNSEFYQPFGSSPRYFVAPRIDLSQTNYNAFAAEDPVARLRVSEADAGLDLGTSLGSIGEFRIGVFRGAGSAKVKVGDPAIPNIYFDRGGLSARLRFDSLDNAQFPRSGTYADLQFKKSIPGLGADTGSDTVETELTSAWSHGKSTLQLGLSYATTIDQEGAIQEYFPLGGFLRLSGLERGEISGPHAALARLVFYRRVGKSLGGLFDVPVYLGASLEAGNTWQSRSDIGIDSARISGSLFGGLDTYVGPIYLAAGFAEGGGSNFYLFIGAPPR